jgi:AhpD family alkylhydroperoxidase
MRLEPIENPPGLLLKIGYWLSRRRFGAVISPLKVIYARSPRLARLGYRIGVVLESGLSLESELVLLVSTQSSLINGCTFCADLHRAQAIQKKIGLEKFKHLLEAATSPIFSDRERAALVYTEEVTRKRNASDASFEELRKHFNEREIVELTWLNAVGNYFNLMAVPLGIESDDLVSQALAKAS